MPIGHMPPLVKSLDWKNIPGLTYEQMTRLYLVDDDLRSAQVAFDSYMAARLSWHKLESRVTSENDRKRLTVLHANVMYHAKSYVCVMRRVGRLLESLSKSRSTFPPAVSTVVKSVWRRKKAMFDEFTAPRNAIEHIDGEIRGRTRWFILNIENDQLYVTEEDSVRLALDDLVSAIEGRNEIIDSLRCT